MPPGNPHGAILIIENGGNNGKNERTDRRPRAVADRLFRSRLWRIDGPSGLDAAAIRAGLETDEAHLDALGYDAELCLTDFGETAETVLHEWLDKKFFDCILIGAGVRLIAQNTLLFEELVNVVHVDAPPQAKLCFNTKPTDTAAAVQRWCPATKQ
jgi:hypothetical protein